MSAPNRGRMRDHGVTACHQTVAPHPILRTATANEALCNDAEVILLEKKKTHKKKIFLFFFFFFLTPSFRFDWTSCQMRPRCAP